MKEYKNGICREIEAEEIMVESTQQPTVEERLEVMETAFMEFVEVMMNG